MFAGTRFEIGNAIPEIRQSRPRDLNQRTANRAVCFVDWLDIRGVSRGSSVTLSSTDHNHHHMQGSGAPEMQERHWPWEHQCHSQRHYLPDHPLRCRGEDSGHTGRYSINSSNERWAGRGEERRGEGNAFFKKEANQDG